MRFFRDRSRRSLDQCTAPTKPPQMPKTCGMVKSQCPAPVGGGCYEQQPRTDATCAQLPKQEEGCETPTNLIVAIDFTSVRSALDSSCSCSKPCCRRAMRGRANTATTTATCTTCEAHPTPTNSCSRPSLPHWSVWALHTRYTPTALVTVCAPLYSHTIISSHTLHSSTLRGLSRVFPL